MTRQLTAGIVGCGKRGRVHAAALRRSGCFRLAALCDADTAVLAEAGRDLGVDRTYVDPGELVGHERPDLVVISTRPEGRAEVVEQVVGAGTAHVLLEKPIALRPSEVDRIRSLGSRSLVAVNTQYGWMPHWRQLRRAVAAGVLGDVTAIVCSTRTNALEQGPHVLDLAFGLARDAALEPPGWVLAAAAGVEPFADVLVPADLSALVGLGPARLHWSQGPCAPEVKGETVFWHHIQVAVVGSAGALQVTLGRGWWLRAGSVREHGETSWPADDDVAQAALYVDLAETILGRARRAFPTQIGYAAACSDVIFASFAAAARGERIELPFHADDGVLADVAALREK